MTSSKSNNLSQTLTLIPSVWGLELQCMRFGGGHSSIHSNNPVLEELCMNWVWIFFFFFPSEQSPCHIAGQEQHLVLDGICGKRHLCRGWLECLTYSKTKLGWCIGSMYVCWVREDTFSQSYKWGTIIWSGHLQVYCPSFQIPIFSV